MLEYDDIPDDHDVGFGADGLPTTMSLANAVQAWAILQTHEGPNGVRPATVGRAAEAFNVTPERIAEAVEMHAWMFLMSGGPLADQEIEHEGV